MSEANSPKKNPMTEAEWYTASWNYFSLLSGQRMQMLQYCITLEVFLAGAFVTLIGLNVKMPWAEATVCWLIVLVSVVFWCFDQRTRNMIHVCEELMSSIDNGVDGGGKLHPIKAVNENKKFPITYNLLISFLHIIFTIAGLTGAMLVLFNVI